jgi:undecaprenyl-diphosphatase
MTPLILLIMLVALVRLRSEYAGGILFWFSIPVIGFFLIKSIQAKVQANWALPAYITAIVAFAIYFLRTFRDNRKWEMRLTGLALVIAVAVTSVAHYPAMLNLPVALNPAARLTGWKELGSEVSAWHERMSLDRPVFIFSDRYQVSSQLAFYVKGQPITYCINIDRRMNQYDLWPSFDSRIHHHAIFVRTGDVSIPEKVSAAFERVEKKVFTAYTNNHAKIRDYSIFLCYDFKGLDLEKPKTF